MTSRFLRFTRINRKLGNFKSPHIPENRYSYVYDKNIDVIETYKSKREYIWKLVKENQELIEYIQKAEHLLNEPVPPRSAEDLFVVSQFKSSFEKTKRKLKRNLEPEEDLRLKSIVEDELKNQWKDLEDSKNQVEILMRDQLEKEFKNKTENYKSDWVKWVVEQNMVRKEVQVLVGLVPSLHEMELTKIIRSDKNRRWFLYNAVEYLIKHEKGTENIAKIFYQI